MSRRDERSDPSQAATPGFLVLAGLVALLGLAVMFGFGALTWSALRPAPGEREPARLEGDLHALFALGDGRVIFGNHAGLRASSDGGASFGAPGGEGDVTALASSRLRPGWLYAAGHGLLLQSRDGGANWAALDRGDLPGDDLHGFAVAPDTDELFAVVAGRGLFRSGDGARWTRLAGSPVEAIIAAGPGTPPVLYAPGRGALWRSDDGGLRWRVTARVSEPRDVAVDPTSGTVYAASATGVLRSSDQGASWTRIGPNAPIALVASAGPSGELIAVALDGRVYRSADTGRTWN